MILVNARFLTQKITGVQRYAIEMSRELKKIQPSIKFVSPKNIVHHEIAKELEVETYGCLNGHLWEQIELPIFAKSFKDSILINLANTAPIFYRNKLVVLHDLAFVRYPENFSFFFRNFYRGFVPLIICFSKFVVTSSQFSRNEINEIYGIPKKAITVIPCSASSIFNHVSSKKEGYILAVSSISPLKNFPNLIKAFSKLNIPDLELHIVGGVNNNFSHTIEGKLIKENTNIKMLGHVSDEELSSLYTKAICFVYPSFYEGFGIPPLEAQASGCPCTVSNRASLPEVLLDSALYFNPYSVDDMVEKIKMLILDKPLREKYINLGLENIKRYSWKNSAKDMLNLLQ